MLQYVVAATLVAGLMLAPGGKSIVVSLHCVRGIVVIFCRRVYSNEKYTRWFDWQVSRKRSAFLRQIVLEITRTQPLLEHAVLERMKVFTIALVHQTALVVWVSADGKNDEMYTCASQCVWKLLFILYSPWIYQGIL